MRLRPLLTLLSGVAIAGSAVVYIHTFMRSPVVEQTMQNVFMAVEPIPFGYAIEPHMVTARSWPADAIPSGAFGSLEEIVGNDETRPRRAKFAFAEGEVLLRSKLSDFGEQVTLTQQIEKGMRAVTVRVDDVTGVAGLIAASDRVDLTLTRAIDQNLVTSTILQNVEVLSLDQSGKGANAPTKVRAVTVQVKPDEAQKLALAQQAGTLSLSLRHIDAADRPTLSSISVSDLVEQAKPKPTAPRPGLPSVVVNRAGERSTVEVPSG